MEKIRINALDIKDSGLVIVKYDQIPTGNTIAGMKNCEATLNTKWQSQEVDYLEKDVGLGGECSVLIVKKGDYTNITKVDMTSAVKGSVEDEKALAYDNNASSKKDKSITCQCLLKIAGKDVDGVNADYGACVCDRLRELIGAYKLGLSLLE